MTSNLRVRNYRAAFTLIELLVVIAIIAILAAILFPVAGTVQESARRGATMSNLQKIHQAVAAYELDNREYPEFLFGPAICKANGAAVGSPEYSSCRKDRDVQRSNAIQRADRAQRNLGEYMLNNPDRR